MKSAAIYMRVNRNLDIRNQELEDFQRVCDQALSTHPDWCLKETYVDIGLGRKAKKCDDKLLQLLDEAYSGKIQVIITPSILTFTRNNNDTLSIIRKLKEPCQLKRLRLHLFLDSRIRSHQPLAIL